MNAQLKSFVEKCILLENLNGVLFMYGLLLLSDHTLGPMSEGQLYLRCPSYCLHNIKTLKTNYCLTGNSCKRIFLNGPLGVKVDG